MSSPGPVLVGTKGVVEGEVFPIEAGKPVVIGRSRSCEISLRNCKRWIEVEKAGAPPEEASKTVSRKHVKLRFDPPATLEIEDLSSNGTFVDGKRIDRVVLTDGKSHEILLGSGEVFRLEWR